LTCYNPETNSCATIGDGFVDQLMPLGLKVDKLVSASTKSKGRRKRNMRKRMAKIRHHMKNKVTDMHRKACNYLTESYEHVFLPYFDTNRICDSITRNIGNKAVRKIMTLSHGAFRTRLEHVVKTKQRSLFYVPEAYTTKTCPACGRENDIGASKWHSCGCGYSGERDRTAARNICISTLSLIS
jgi:putative transposase